jgi:hypothetical protein
MLNVASFERHAMNDVQESDVEGFEPPAYGPRPMRSWNTGNRRSSSGERPDSRS